MSYRFSAALQAAVYQRLSGLAGVTVYDALPAGELPQTYVLIGAEEVLDASDASGVGAEHRLRLQVFTSEAGFQEGKALGVRISEALEAGLPALAVGRLVGISFLRAEAKRMADGMRRIELVFRARLSA